MALPVRRHNSAGAVVSPDARDLAAQLIAEGCYLAEVARTVGVAKSTIERAFPDAPRMTRQERSEWANWCRSNRVKVGL